MQIVPFIFTVISTAEYKHAKIIYAQELALEADCS